MKLGSIFASIVSLILVITLAGNSLEVMGQCEPQQGLKRYENDKYGISFQYPSSWWEDVIDDCKYPILGLCGPILEFSAPQKINSNTTDGAWWQSS